ncbi:MAG: aspartate:alanine exchanger family transporter [Pseudomonadales bacterium]
MTEINAFLVQHPVGLLFLVVGLGYLVGKVRIFGFDLGPVTGVLFVGLLFGHRGYELSPTVQTMGFVLFIFSVGLQAGPRFFSVLRTDGLRYLALAIVISGTGFAIALSLARALDFEFGAAAGLLAGGMTSSPTLAAAQEALRAGQIGIPSDMAADQVLTNVTTAYAITYIFGLVGLIMLIRFLPKLLGIDFKAEAARLAEEQQGGVEDAVQTLSDITVRAYRVKQSELVGVPLKTLYPRLPGLAALSKLRRNGEMLELTPDTTVAVGDEVTVVGYRHRLVEVGSRLGTEIEDAELLNEPIESCRVLVMRTKVKRLTLRPLELIARYGCFVAKIERGGMEVPLGPVLDLQAGDVLHLTGRHASLDQLGAELGHVERDLDETDLVTFGLGIAVGTFIGGVSISVFGISVGLGSAGGLLAAGLMIGYLRAIRPVFGRVPSAARWIFMELGLLIFMCGVGLKAGSGILDTLASSGPTLLGAGALVTVIPVLVGFAVGRWLLKIHPVLLLGAITGSMTSGAALSIVNREAGNTLPSLGYTGAYAFANVLLTIAGSIILLL